MPSLCSLTLVALMLVVLPLQERCKDECARPRTSACVATVPKMAHYVAEARWRVALWGSPWKAFMSEGLSAAAAVAASAPCPRLGFSRSTTAAQSIRRVTDALSFRQRTMQERESAVPTSVLRICPASPVSMRKKRSHHSAPSIADTPSQKSMLFLENIPADAAVACLQLLASRCRLNEKRSKTADVVKGESAAMDSADFSEKLPEDHRSRGDILLWKELVTQAYATGSAGSPVVTAYRGAAQMKSGGSLASQHGGLSANGLKDKESQHTVRLLLHISLEKKDDLSGLSIVKLLTAMLTLRICAPEVLTELAGTIRRRLVHVLPADGLAAIAGIYCFFFATVTRCADARSVSNNRDRCVPGRLPASVKDLLTDAFTQISLRLGLQRYYTGARESKEATDSNARDGKRVPGTQRSNEALPKEGILQARGGANHVYNSSVATCGDVSACASAESGFSRAGALCCAWALSRLTVSQKKSSALEHLTEYSSRTFSLPAIQGVGMPTTSNTVVQNRTAWNYELSRLREWGATAAAFVHIPGDIKKCIAGTAEKEVMATLRNLRLILLHNRKIDVPTSPFSSGSSGVPRVRQPVCSSSQAAALIVEGERLQKSAPSYSSRCTTEVITQPLCAASGRGARNKYAEVTCDEVAAATICGAVTSVLRLCALTQHDSGPTLEALQMLHGQDPFMFRLPQTDLCYFVAAAHEGAAHGLQPVDSKTLFQAVPVRPVTSCLSKMYHVPDTAKTGNLLGTPAILRWTLLLLPRMTEAPDTLFSFMPPRVLALLLTMLSHLPGSLALIENGGATATCLPVGQQGAVQNSIENRNPSSEGRVAHFTTPQQGGGPQGYPALREDVDIEACRSFEEKLVKFSAQLCRAVIERSACFGLRDLGRAIFAAQRLDSDARQLPFSGASWLQHPDFSRVLECLVRALRRRRNGGARRLETHATRTSDHDDVHMATRGTEECPKLEGYVSSVSTADNHMPATATWLRSDPPKVISVARKACWEVFCRASYDEHAGEDTRMLQLVCDALQPCFSQHKVNKTGGSDLKDSTGMGGYS